MGGLSLRAPAKINIHLEILGRRADGYHDIRSIFHLISLSDIVTVRALPGKHSFELEGEFDFDPANNTIVTAVKLFREASGMNAGIGVSLKKAIPAGGGLGGGSSDAAAILRLLNRFFAQPVSPAVLLELAAMIGSDVPFFLTAPAAIVEGRGELVTPVRPLGEDTILLFRPGFAVATAEAYSWWDDAAAGIVAQPLTRDELRLLWEGAPECWPYRNDFQVLLEKRFSFYEELKKGLSSCHPLYAGLSGSGAVFYAVFRKKRDAVMCARRLRAVCHEVLAVSFLTELPEIYDDNMFFTTCQRRQKPIF